MSTVKNKKAKSIRYKLIAPTTIIFLVFVFAMAISAYFTYSSSITNQTLTQIKNMSQQVLSNYNTYFETVIAVSDNVQVKVDNSDLDNPIIKTNIKNYLDEVMTFKEEIIDISIYKEDGTLSVANSKYVAPRASNEDGWFKSAVENPLINVFSRVDYTGGSYSFTLSKYINVNKGLDHCILKVDYDFKKIITLIAQTDLGSGGHITIYDNNYNIVYTSNSVITNDETDAVKSLVMGTKTVHLDTDYVLFASTITNTTWRVAIFTNNEALASALKSYLIVILSISLGTLALFIVILSLVSNSITSPLRKLQREMIKVENLNYVVANDTNIKGSSKEVEDLNRSFNQMMIRIKELMERVLEEQEEQRKSELKALQNQINPHFLYNTFDSVIYMIDKGENEKAEEMIVALSKFFRISVSKGHNIIPLKNEVDHAQYYLQIQKLRFGDTFEYKFNVDENLYKYNVLKLILQPIVENAIGHGIKELQGKVGLITVNAYEHEGFIIFEIIDNGFGILPEKIDEIYKSFNDNSIHNGVGLKNVYERIRIYYGDKADVKIESELDQGTKVTILIPVEGALKNAEE